MSTIASVATVLASGVNPNWLNSERNAGLLCNVLIAAGVNMADIRGSSSSLPACMTIATIPFPLSC